MATAAGNEYEDTLDQCDSLTQESDEIQEMYCEHCEKELGTIVTAEGFCVECVEYLCSTCIRYHKKYVPDHTLQDSANMPQDFCFEKCQTHTSELIKFHCNSCETSACAQCRVEIHNGCTIEHIPTLLRSIDMNDEARQIQLLIDQNLAELATSKDNTSAKLEKVYSNSRNVSTSIKQHKESLQSEVEDFCRKHLDVEQEKELENYNKRRAALLAKLDKEKEKIIRNHRFEKRQVQDKIRLTKKEIEKRGNHLNGESETLKKTDEQKLQTVLSKANKTEADLTELKEILIQKMKTRQKSGVFLTLNKVKKDFEKLKIDSKDVNKDTEINDYEFQPENDKVDNLPPKPNINFGSLVEKPDIMRKIIPLQSIPVKSDDDKEGSKITGLCKLSGNFLVAADNNNDSIKLIDTTKKTISSVFRLKSKPFDVTKVDDNKIATTLPNVGNIQYLSIKLAKLSLDQEIPVKKGCHGIVYKKPNLIVIFTYYPAEVQILDMDGTLLETFSSPRGHTENIALSSINNMIYIPEMGLFDSQRIISKLSMNGEILSREKMPVSHGIAIDKLGTIYMCHLSGSAIIQLSADLKTKQELHLEPEHRINLPISLFYCNKENKLYVGTESGDIYVFKIEKS